MRIDHDGGNDATELLVNDLRAGHQLEDRQGARRDTFSRFARHCRRGDGVTGPCRLLANVRSGCAAAAELTNA
jgi:hypothetical protein